MQFDSSCCFHVFLQIVCIVECVVFLVGWMGDGGGRLYKYECIIYIFGSICISGYNIYNMLSMCTYAFNLIR